MTESYDLNLVGLHRSAGRDLPGLPGVHVAQPPRRVARGRKQDGFIGYLHVASGPTLSREQSLTLLQSLERTFYGTPGSATAALRELAEGLNETLLNRNLKGGGEPSVVYLTLMALREDMLFMAQCGPAHGFLMTRAGIEHLHDPETSGRGLGVARTPQIRFFQTPLSPGALLLFVPKLPAGWNSATFREVVGRPLGYAARRFLDDAGTDLQAVLIEARPGNGQLALLRTPAAAQQPVARPAETAAPEILQEKASPPVGAPARVESIKNRPREVEAEAEEPLAARSPLDRPAQRIKPERTPEVKKASPIQIALGRLPAVSALAGGAASGLGAALRQAGARLKAFLGRMLPTDEMLNLPASTMALVAVAVPVVVTTVALVIYLNLGREQGYQTYLGQAQLAAESAAEASDSSEAAAGWQNTLALLERAEAYSRTPETDSLRQRAQGALDELEGVFRLTFTPAISGSLSGSIRIRQMVATGTNLYMLDANSGRVLRAWLTGRGYELDPTFSCGPAQHGQFIVGPVVDIVAVPQNEQGAEIVAMDGNGNLMFCIPEKAPLVAPLTPPDSAWGNPSALAVDGGRLYVLDPLTNAVWLYDGEDGQFPGPPRFFFGAEVPALGGAIDLAVNGADLFVLHSDGHYTLCVFSSLRESPTRCEDPAVYTDDRPGRAAGSQVAGATFSQLEQTDPPEPSLFFLDPITRSVYHFSLRVNLVRQYRVQSDFPPGLVTAFAVSPTRAIFLAVGNQVYLSYLP